MRMRSCLSALLIFLAVFLGNVCFAGDSTSLAPSGSGSSHNLNTHGGHVKTEGGNVYTSSGDVHTDEVHGNDFYGDTHSYRAYIRHMYGKGSGWIDVRDHFDMNNNVIYDARRVRVNDTWPNRDDDLASKRYVDSQANIDDCRICLQCYYDGGTRGSSAKCQKVNSGWSGWTGDHNNNGWPSTDNALCRIKMYCP